MLLDALENSRRLQEFRYLSMILDDSVCNVREAVDADIYPMQLDEVSPSTREFNKSKS